MEESAKSNLKRVSLELGGKSPLVVFNDFNGKHFLHLYFTTFGQTMWSTDLIECFDVTSQVQFHK